MIINNFLVISIFFQLCVIEAKVEKSPLSSCGSYLMIDYCPEEPVSRKIANKFRCTYVQADCTPKIGFLNLHIDVENNSMQSPIHVTNTNSHVFVAKENTLGKGTLILWCKLGETNDNEGKNIEFAVPCAFSMKPEPPIVIIDGGTERYVTSEEPFQMSGAESFKIDNSIASFSWECTVLKGVEKCPDVKNEPITFTIDESLATHGMIYKFTLTLVSNEGDTASMEQKVIVLAGAPVTSIKCLKNCPPSVKSTDSRERTVLKLDCTKRCQNVGSVLWKVKGEGEPFEEDRDYSINKDLNQITLEMNMMKNGKEYIVYATIGDEGGCDYKLNVGNIPQLADCTVEPPKGESMETEFFVKCDREVPGNTKYRISSLVNDKEVLLNEGIDLTKLPFQLPVGSKVQLRVVNEHEFSDSKTLNVEVSSAFSRKNNTIIEEQISKKLSEVKQDIENEDFARAIQTVNSLSEEVSKLSKEDSKYQQLKEDTHKEILELLDTIPISSNSGSVKQIAEIVATMVDQYEKSSPEISNKATTLCKKIATAYSAAVERESPNPVYKTSEAISVLSNCSEASMKINEDAVLIGNSTVNVTTTPYPLLSVLKPTEEYVDYVEDDNVSNSKFQFHESILNMADICYINGNIFLRQTVPGEGVLSFFKSNIKITVYKNIGLYFGKTVLQSDGVSLDASDDYKNVNEPKGVVMCTLKKNIFWWYNNEPLTSSIAFIKFNNEDTRFSKPFRLIFDLNPTTNNETRSNETVQEDYVYNGMSVYRIDVFSTYRVDFHDLSTEEYTVLITEFIKPTIKELKREGIKVNKENSTIDHFYDKKYHSWHYLNILKENDKPVPRITVGTYACHKWLSNEAQWDFACGSTKESSSSKVICQCYSASILKGQYDENSIRLEVISEMSFELGLEPQYIIFIILLIMFILFLLLFTYISIKKKKHLLDKNILFVPDVPRYCKYAYMLVVHTGKGIRDGTTSNITIKLNGTNASTQEHVLNYPDPERRLLQRGNEDWFVLGSERYLGNLQNIEIWFDSIGIQPNWFCKNIEVYDFQSNKYWHFNINHKFSLEIMKEPIIIVDVDIEKHEQKTKFQMCKGGINACTGPHFWIIEKHKFEEYSNFFRLVVVYSIILSILCMSLVLYGWPHFKKSDALEYYINYRVNFNIILNGFLSSIISLVIHSPLVILYGKINSKEQNNVLKKYKYITIACWAFFTANIIICNSMLIIFGFWVPNITGLLWLTSITFGIVIYGLIFENILKLMFRNTIQKALKARLLQERFNILLDFIEHQRFLVFHRFGQFGLRPYLQHLHKPLDETELLLRQEYSQYKLRARELLEDLIMFLIYIIILYIVILVNRDYLAVFNNIHMHSVFEDTDLKDIKSYFEIAYFIEDDLIDILQSSSWYPFYTTDEPGLMIDKHNSYIGVGRFRQHRTVRNSCKLPSPMEYLNITCHPEYSESKEISNFTEGWVKGKMNTFSRLYRIWNYVNASDDETGTYRGQIASYEGGGYIAPCGRTFTNSHINWNYLNKHNWIDTKTRALIFEFLSYNVHSNLFNNVRLVIEISASGALKKKIQVETSRLLFVNDELELMTTVVCIGFLVVLIIFTCKVVIVIIRRRKVVLKHFDIWLIIDICIIILSIVCIALTQYRDRLVREFLSEIEKTAHNVFIGHFNLFYAEMILSLMAAVLICVSTVRLWKLLRFMVVFRIMERTLILAFVPSVALFIWHLLVLLAYSFSGFAFFNDISDGFKTITSSFVSLVLCSIGQNYQIKLSIFTNFVYCTYYITFMYSNMVMMTMHVAIIMSHYHQAQLEYSNVQQYTAKEFMKERITFIYNLFKLRIKKERIRGGEDDNYSFRYVYPKAEEHRYADCVSITKHRMKQMNFVAQCILRNLKSSSAELTETDVELINTTIYTLHTKYNSENDIFYLDDLDKKHIKLIDDYKMQKMEKIAILLLDPDALTKLDLNNRAIKLYTKAIENHNNRLFRLKKYFEKLTSLMVNINVNLKTNQ